MKISIYIIYTYNLRYIYLYMYNSLILQGIYDIHTQMAGIPILPWEAPPLSNNIYASEIMSHPIVTLKTVENVGHIIELLKCVTFNGFPVVDPPSSDEVMNPIVIYIYKRYIIFLYLY